MILPSEVLVLGVPVEVQEVESVETNGFVGDGVFLATLGLIQIRTGATTHRKLEVLLHEVIHAVDDAMGINLSEAQVTRLARGLYGVFVGCPNFLKVFSCAKKGKL